MIICSEFFGNYEIYFDGESYSVKNINNRDDVSYPVSLGDAVISIYMKTVKENNVVLSISQYLLKLQEFKQNLLDES